MTVPKESYRTIPLSRGQVVVVDESDYEWLAQWKWHAWKNPKNGNFYAQGGPNRGYMHRLILELEKGDTRRSDHANHDTLDNRRANLRVATATQNNVNRIANKRTHSCFKGVVARYAGDGRRIQALPWQARIKVNGVLRILGNFAAAEQAHQAYCEAARICFGEFFHDGKANGPPKRPVTY